MCILWPVFLCYDMPCICMYVTRMTCTTLPQPSCALSHPVDQGIEVTINGPNGTPLSKDDLSRGIDDRRHRVRGPGLLTTLVYLAFLLLVIPLCRSGSWRFCLRRHSSKRGSSYADGGVLGSTPRGSGGWLGWRSFFGAMMGGVGGVAGGGSSKDGHEMVPLALTEGEEIEDFLRGSDNPLGKRI